MYKRLYKAEKERKKMRTLINLEKAFNYMLTIIECIDIGSLYLVQASDNHWYLINADIEGQFNTKDEALEYLELYNLNKSLETILNDEALTNYKRTMALSGLMTDMERQFNIPLLRDIEWEKHNQEVINLYRKIADSRNFDF